MLESAIDISNLENSSILGHKLSNHSSVKEMLKDELDDTIKEGSLRERFRDIKNRLNSQQSFRYTEIGREDSPGSDSKTFRDRVNSCKRLLNSIKVSPVNEEKSKTERLKSTFVCPRMLISSFEDKNDENYVIKISDQESNVLEEVEATPDFEFTEQSSQEIQETENMEKASLAKPTLFNLVSMCRRPNLDS